MRKSRDASGTLGCTQLSCGFVRSRSIQRAQDIGVCHGESGKTHEVKRKDTRSILKNWLSFRLQMIRIHFLPQLISSPLNMLSLTEGIWEKKKKRLHLS